MPTGYRNPMQFHENLRTIRRRAKLSQRSLAEMSGVGLSTVQQYERATRDPGLRNVFRLAKALDVQPVELIGDR